MKKVTILDCTLRDGGYYTNWDFNQSLVDDYIEAINVLPIDIIEIGYRSQPQKDYLGEYFYCPQYVINHITSKCTKQVAIMFNEKDVRPEMLDELLLGCENIDVIRLAIDPKNFKRALLLAEAIKERGFEVALNVMYMSKWSENSDFMNAISNIGGKADYLNMVDSYGGVYPDDIKNIYSELKTKTEITIGFHGHNNLELGLINSLQALECGAGIIDATFTGMGRGAGNTKMELLLTALNSRYNLEVDFSALGNIVNEFEELKKDYNWGTNLPYMIAGANSFPQKDVMNWVSNRFYSYNSIIRSLQNKKEGRKDNHSLEQLPKSSSSNRIVIIGGGPSALLHCEGILDYLNNNPDFIVIHASSKNVKPFIEIKNRQLFCLVGNEGHRLESNFEDLSNFNGQCVLPPFPRKMGTYIPEGLLKNSVELESISYTKTLVDTHTAIALQAAIDLKASEVLLVGYDGYTDNVSSLEKELTKENQYLFDAVKGILDIKSVFPTEYDVNVVSLYSMLNGK